MTDRNNKVVLGKRDITADTALRLVFGYANAAESRHGPFVLSRGDLTRALGRPIM